MNGFGGMITAVLRGDLAVARRFLEKCWLFALAESLGGVESLIEHPAIMTHASVPAEQRRSRSDRTYQRLALRRCEMIRGRDRFPRHVRVDPLASALSRRAESLPHSEHPH
jgi:hypothetical protein